MKSQRRLMKIRAVVRLLNFPNPAQQPPEGSWRLPQPAISSPVLVFWDELHFPVLNALNLFLPRVPPVGLDTIIFLKKEKAASTCSPVTSSDSALVRYGCLIFVLTIIIVIMIIVIYRFTRPFIRWPHRRGWLSPTGGTWCKLILKKIRKKSQWTRSHAF